MALLSSVCCLLPVACCLLPVACCLLPVACCLLPVACCLLPVALHSRVVTRLDFVFKGGRVFFVSPARRQISIGVSIEIHSDSFRLRHRFAFQLFGRYEFTCIVTVDAYFLCHSFELFLQMTVVWL
jgi:hypothetical protein